MTRRFIFAAAYTVFVVCLLLTWPKWTVPPQLENQTVITAAWPARWLLIFIPVLWGWAAFYLEPKWRKLGLIGSILLLVGCFLLIWYHDNVLTYSPCLWDDGRCGSGWFR